MRPAPRHPSSSRSVVGRSARRFRVDDVGQGWGREEGLPAWSDGERASARAAEAFRVRGRAQAAGRATRVHRAAPLGAPSGGGRAHLRPAPASLRGSRIPKHRACARRAGPGSLGVAAGCWAGASCTAGPTGAGPGSGAGHVPASTSGVHPGANEAAMVYGGNGNATAAYVAKGSTVLMSPFVLQHDARFWEDADKFIPERWETQSDRHGPS